jgi:hypothetical protein
MAVSEDEQSSHRSEPGWERLVAAGSADPADDRNEGKQPRQPLSQTTPRAVEKTFPARASATPPKVTSNSRLPIRLPH